MRVLVNGCVGMGEGEEVKVGRRRGWRWEGV